MIGLILGVFMGVTHSFDLLSVHSHIGLLGWTAMAITGLVYIALPRCDGNRLARSHFRLVNLGVPAMIAGLLWHTYTGSTEAESLMGIGSVVVVIAMLLFTLNVFKSCTRA